MLILFTVLLAVSQTATPIPRKAANTAAQHANQVKSDANSHKQPVTPPALPVSSAEKPEGDKQATANKVSPNEEQSVRIRELPPVSVSRDWADWTLWLANALLAAVGIVGIGFAYFTLRAIKEQTSAELIAAKATEASVKLQRVAMQQWIDTADWEAGPRFIQPTATEGFLPISFTIVNNTKFKMYLDRVTVWIDREESVSIWYRNKLLTPDGDVQPVAIERRLIGVKLESYRGGVYRFEIGGVVSYLDAFGDKQEEKFGFQCSSRMSARADFEPIAFYPPDAAELEAQKKKKAQTQQDSSN